MLVSNESLTGLSWFPAGAAGGEHTGYNTILRWFYDGLYRLNVGCDFLWTQQLRREPPNPERYRLIVVPALYAAEDAVLRNLSRYVENGGHLIAGFKSGFADENLKVRTCAQPGLLSACCGVTYSRFTVPQNVLLSGFALPEEELRARV